MSIDSHPASSSSTHFSSSKLIRFGSGSVFGLTDADGFVLSVFFEEVDRLLALADLVLGSSFSHDSKLESWSLLGRLVFDLDCSFIWLGKLEAVFS